jgi:fumarate reductase iron-sulfur subunit
MQPRRHAGQIDGDRPPGRTVEVTVMRFDPAVDRAPRYERYAIDGGEQLKVLDALRQIAERYDGGLAFRWACGIARCGTCTVNVDGRPVLSCQEPLPRDCPVIEPVSRHPVLLDLIVDRERVAPPSGGRLGDERRERQGRQAAARPCCAPNRGASIKGGI